MNNKHLVKEFRNEYRFLSNFWLCDIPVYNNQNPHVSALMKRRMWKEQLGD